MNVIQFRRILKRSTLGKVGFALLIFAASISSIAQDDPFFGPKAPPAGPALFGKDGASPKAVREGSSSASYFHAAIGAIANATPATLHKAIIRNPGGGYKVDFPDGSEEYVLDNDMQLAHTRHLDNSEGEWVVVLMRGYAQHSLRTGIIEALQNSTTIPEPDKSEAITLFGQSGPLLVAYDRGIRSASQEARIDNGVLKLDKANLKQALTTQFKALDISATEYKTLLGILDDGTLYDTLGFIVQRDGEVFGAPLSAVEVGIPIRVFQAFMGSGTLFTVSDQDMTMKFLNLTTTGQAMAASTRAALPAGITDATWWVSGHAFTVMDYNATSQTVTLRNPQGTLPAPDGVFTIPLATFIKAFETGSATSNQ